jgi:hypothetical protein
LLSFLRRRQDPKFRPRRNAGWNVEGAHLDQCPSLSRTVVVSFRASHRERRPAIIELFLKSLGPFYTRSQGPKRLEATFEHFFGVANWPQVLLVLNTWTLAARVHQGLLQNWPLKFDGIIFFQPWGGAVQRLY